MNEGIFFVVRIFIYMITLGFFVIESYKIGDISILIFSGVIMIILEMNYLHQYNLKGGSKE